MSLGSIGENSYFADSLDNFQSMFNNSSLDFDDKNNSLDNNSADNFIDEETAEKEYVTQSQLYLDAMKSITQLKQRLIRRTSIIDEIRKYYLRDIITVKELINQVLTTDERKAFLSLYDQNLPSLDMTQSLILHSPSKCEMVVKHCSECGGHVEIIMKDSDEVERLKKIISDCKDREGRFRIKLGELDVQIENTTRDKSEALKRFTEEKKYLYNEMKKLRTQHEQLQEEMDVHTKAHKKLQAENIGYKAKLNSLIHASELLEQADVVKENIKAELAEANNTIKQMKTNEKNIHKELTLKKTQIQELNQNIDVVKEESRVLKNDKDNLNTQIDKLKYTNKELNSQLIDLNQKQSNSTNRIKSLEDTLEKLKKIQQNIVESMHTRSSPAKGSEQDLSSNRKHKRRSSQRTPSEPIVAAAIAIDSNKVLPNITESVEVVTQNNSSVVLPNMIEPIVVTTTEASVILPNIIEPTVVLNAEVDSNESLPNINTEPMKVTSNAMLSSNIVESIKDFTELDGITNDFNTEANSNEREIQEDLKQVVESTTINNEILEIAVDPVSDIEDEDDDETGDDDEYDEDDVMKTINIIRTEEEMAEEQKRNEILKIAEEIYEKRKNGININIVDDNVEVFVDAGNLNSIGSIQPTSRTTIALLDQSTQCDFIMSNITCQTDISGDMLQSSERNHHQINTVESEYTDNNDIYTPKEFNIENVPPSPSALMIKRRKSLPREMSIRQLTLKNLNDPSEEYLHPSDDLQHINSDNSTNDIDDNNSNKDKKLLLRLEQLKKEFEQGVYRQSAITIKNDDGSTTTTTAAELASNRGVYTPVPVITIEKHVKIVQKPKPKAAPVIEVVVPEIVVPIVVPKKEPRKTIITDPVVPLDPVAEDASEYELLLRSAMEQALKEYPNTKPFEINKYLNAVNKTIHHFCTLFDKSLDATWSSLLSNRSNLDSLTRMNFILDGMVTSADPKIDRDKFESLYKKIHPYTEMQINAKVTSSWKDDVRISDEMIFELNPRIDEYTGKSILKRYEEYYNGSLKTDLNDKVNNSLDTIKKMSKYTDRATNKLIKYLPELIQDWQKVKLEYFGINNKIAHEVEIVQKGLETKLQIYQRELEVVNKDNIQHLLEIEKLNSRIKELLIKELDLNNAKITIEEKVFVIDEKNAQITELLDDLDCSKLLNAEKDERICELEKIIGSADENIIKLNENIQDNVIEIQNLKNSLSEMTKEKDSFKIDYENMVKKEEIRLHGLVSTFMQVEPFVNDQAIQTEFVAPPMNLRTMIAGKHSNANARGKQRSTQVFSQSLDASHSIDSFYTNNMMLPQVDNLYGDLICEGSMFSSSSALQSSVGTDRTRKLGYSKVIHLQQASTPLTPLIFKHTNSIVPPQSHNKDGTISKSSNSHSNTLNFTNSVASIGSATIPDGLVGNSLNKPRNYHPTSSVYSIDSYYGDLNDNVSLASSNQLKVGFADDATTRNNVNTKRNHMNNGSSKFQNFNADSNPTASGSFQYVHNEQKVPQKYLIDQHSSNFPLGLNTSSNNHAIHDYTRHLENVVDSSPSPHHRRTEVDVGLPEVKVLSYAQQMKQQQNQIDQIAKTSTSFISTSSENKIQRSDSFNLDSPRTGSNIISNLSIRHQLEKDNILSKINLQPGYDLINGIVYNNKGFNDPIVTNRSSSPNSTGSASVTSSNYFGSGIHIDGSSLNNSYTKLHYRNNDSNMHDSSNNEGGMGKSFVNKTNSRVMNALNVIDQPTTTDNGSSSNSTAHNNSKTNNTKSNHNISDEMLRRLRKELVSR